MAVERHAEHAPHLPHLPTPDIGKALAWIKEHPKLSAFVTTAVGVPAAILYMHFERNSHQPQRPIQNADSKPVLTVPMPPDGIIPGIVPTETATPAPSATPLLDKLDALIEATKTPEPIKIETYTPPTVTATLFPEITPSPTTSPTTAPATTTPTAPSKLEVPAEVPCNILPQQFCSQAEVIDWANSKGQKFKIIGFKNIPTGTPLFPPVNAGEITKAKLPERGNFKGFQATISDPNEPNVWYIVSGDITFPDMNNATKKEGEAFGSVGNTGITNAGGYKLLVYVLRRVGQETTSDESIIRRLFPDAFGRPAQQAAASPGSTGTTIHTSVYLDNNAGK